MEGARDLVTERTHTRGEIARSFVYIYLYCLFIYKILEKEKVSRTHNTNCEILLQRFGTLNMVRSVITINNY